MTVLVRICMAIPIAITITITIISLAAAAAAGAVSGNDIARTLNSSQSTKTTSKHTELVNDAIK